MVSLLHDINSLYVFSGFAVGLLVGFTGVGGGSLMTPLLVLAFGVNPATAVGTDLLYAGVTRIGGSVVHGINGSVDWRLVRRLASGSAPTAALTVLALSHWGTHAKQSGGVISTVLGFALLLTAASLAFRKLLLARYGQALAAADDRTIASLTVALGAAVGFLVTISSVGAGAIGVTALLALYPRMPMVRIVGSDIVHGIPLTLIAGAGHWWIGSVDWALLVSLVCGSLPGVVIGSQFAARVPDKYLRPVIAGTLALVGAKLAF